MWTCSAHTVVVLVLAATSTMTCRMKDILHRALSSANVPSQLEPTGLDQMVSILMESPWYHGQIELLVWDAICVDTFATSHLSMTASELCATANQAEQTKIKKYNYLTSHAYHSFTPVAFETTGVLLHFFPIRLGSPHSKHHW